MSAHKTTACGLFGVMLATAVHVVVSVELTGAQQPAPRTTAALYEGALLIPGDGSAPVVNAAFLVQDGAIMRVGARGTITAPAGAVRIDLSGRTVMPALINTHGHPGFQKGLTYGRQNYTRETYLDDLNRAAYYGVRVVMSQGIDPGDLAYELRRDLETGRADGARLLIAGRGIGAPNAGPGAAAYQGIAYEVTTAEEGRAAVSELAAKRVDLVKIWVDDRGGRAPRMPQPVYARSSTKCTAADSRSTRTSFTMTMRSGWWRQASTVWRISCATGKWMGSHRRNRAARRLRDAESQRCRAWHSFDRASLVRGPV